MPCTLRRPGRSRAHTSDRLGPGRSAAPGEQRLSLLPSGPDEVHASPLRGTRSSTPIAPSASANAGLGREFSPAEAVCRYRAPLVPRLARLANHTRARSNGSGRGSITRPGVTGGEGGIRTLDGLPHTAFPVRRPRPLGDLSASASYSARLACRAEGGGEHPSERTSMVRERGRGADNARIGRPPCAYMAERVGFEPTVLAHTAFRERHLQPLGHLSAREDNKGRRSGLTSNLRVT